MRARGRVNIPVTGVRRQTAFALHLSYNMLATAPDENAFSQLAHTINVIGIAITGDVRFVDEMRIISSASAAMNQIGAKEGLLRATQLELLPVLNAVSVIDKLLPRLEVSRLYQAMAQLRTKK